MPLAGLVEVPAAAAATTADPTTGAYTLTVHGSSSTTTGSYSFRVLDLAVHGSTLVVGTAVSDNLDGPTTTDIHQFTGTAGDRLFFVSDRPDAGNDPASEDIWVAARDDVGWGAPRRLPAPVNFGGIFELLAVKGVFGKPFIDHHRGLGRGKRLDESTEGHGIGLSIVNEIVELYGGEIVLEDSGELGGLSVTVELPLQQ